MTRETAKTVPFPALTPDQASGDNGALPVNFEELSVNPEDRALQLYAQHRMATGGISEEELARLAAASPAAVDQLYSLAEGPAVEDEYTADELAHLNHREPPTVPFQAIEDGTEVGEDNTPTGPIPVLNEEPTGRRRWWRRSRTRTDGPETQNNDELAPEDLEAAAMSLEDRYAALATFNVEPLGEDEHRPGVVQRIRTFFRRRERQLDEAVQDGDEALEELIGHEVAGVHIDERILRRARLHPVQLHHNIHRLYRAAHGHRITHDPVVDNPVLRRTFYEAADRGDEQALAYLQANDLEFGQRNPNGWERAVYAAARLSGAAFVHRVGVSALEGVTVNTGSAQRGQRHHALGTGRMHRDRVLFDRVRGENPYTFDTIAARAERYGAAIRDERAPVLGGKFQYEVVPHVKEDRDIPPAIFVAAFARRKVPMVPAGNGLRTRYNLQASSYKKILDIPQVPDLLQVAARRATVLDGGPDVTDSRRAFTRSMRDLTYAMHKSELGHSDDQAWVELEVPLARHAVETLVELANPDMDQTDRRLVEDDIWNRLRIDRGPVWSPEQAAA